MKEFEDKEKIPRNLAGGYRELETLVAFSRGSQLGLSHDPFLKSLQQIIDEGRAQDFLGAIQILAQRKDLQAFKNQLEALPQDIQGALDALEKIATVIGPVREVLATEARQREASEIDRTEPQRKTALSVFLAQNSPQNLVELVEKLESFRQRSPDVYFELPFAVSPEQKIDSNKVTTNDLIQTFNLEGVEYRVYFFQMKNERTPQPFTIRIFRRQGDGSIIQVSGEDVMKGAGLMSLHKPQKPPTSVLVSRGALTPRRVIGAILMALAGAGIITYEACRHEPHEAPVERQLHP